MLCAWFLFLDEMINDIIIKGPNIDKCKRHAIIKNKDTFFWWHGNNIIKLMIKTLFLLWLEWLKAFNSTFHVKLSCTNCTYILYLIKRAIKFIKSLIKPLMQKITPRTLDTQHLLNYFNHWIISSSSEWYHLLCNNPQH